MRAVSSSWTAPNLDKIQQLASAASCYGASGFGDVGYRQADLVERAEREARDKERAAQEKLERERRQEQERIEAERRRQEELLAAERRREQRRQEEEERRQAQAQRDLERDLLKQARLPDFAETVAPKAKAKARSADERVAEAKAEAPRSQAEVSAKEPEALDVYSDDDIDDDFEVVDLDTFEVDDLVIVREDFISDSDPPEELLRGQRGQIVEIDADGDAYIRFREHRKKQWVYSQSFYYLAKVLFDKANTLNVRRSFQCGSHRIRRGQSAVVRRVDAGGDVLMDFGDNIGDQWVQYYSLVFLEKEKPKVASQEAKMWLYNPPSFREVAIRATPSVDGPRSKLTLRPGQRFLVSEEVVGSDGILYLRLADGTGWMFETKPGSGTLCVRQGGGLSGDLLSQLHGRRDDDNKIMHLEDAKAFLMHMQKVLTSKRVQPHLEDLFRELPGKTRDLTEVQKGVETELLREKAKRVLVDASKGVFKQFGFEVSQEGQEELLEALREHQHDDTVFIVASNIEMALQLPAGGWFGLCQLRKGLQVTVLEGAETDVFGKTGTLEKLHSDGHAWNVKLDGQVRLLKPEHLQILPDPTAHKELAKAKDKKIEPKDEELAQTARQVASVGAAQRRTRELRVPEKAPWWQTCSERAGARAASRMLEREYLAIASGSEAAFFESLKQERKAARQSEQLAIEDEPVLPIPEIIEEIEAAEVREAVQRNFKSLALRSREKEGSPRQRGRRGAFSSRAGALQPSNEPSTPEDEEEALRAAEAAARRGDLRPLLRRQKYAIREDAMLKTMTGALQGKDPGLLAVEDRNDVLPPRLTRAQCAREEFERQRARWHLPPRGKHVGYMPQAPALGAGEGNLGALEETVAGVPARNRVQELGKEPPCFGLPSFDEGPGLFGGGGFVGFG
ncbi:unnamed protein product [Effrenium voratum]|uniref:Uncharacterized protein n=1 Tax=Effrenium voratum TaxID=2562239 RepID=A0AA36ILG5_9DINO|nr:unnamed protein product [Effrenium voratum]